MRMTGTQYHGRAEGIPDAELVYAASGFPRPSHAPQVKGRGHYRYWIVRQPGVADLTAYQMFSDFRKYVPDAYHGYTGRNVP